MAELKKEHKEKLKAFAIEQDDDLKAVKAQEMMASLEGRLTEVLLYAAIKAAKDGSIDTFLSTIAEEKEEPKEEPKVEEPPYEPTAVEVPTLTEAEVEEAVQEAEATATGEEKTTGFWRRFAGFFKGLFVKKTEE